MKVLSKISGLCNRIQQKYLRKYYLFEVLLALILLVGLAPNAFAQFEVTNTDDSGTGSLRWAIDQVNASSGAETISFNIPGEGPHTIQLLTPLDPIQTEVSITMFNQAGYDDLPVVMLDGSQLTSGNGLEIQAAGSTIRGLSIINFPGHGLFMNGSDNSSVRDIFLGVETDGNTGAGNGLSGLYVEVSRSLLISGNLISDNGEHGIYLKGTLNGGVADVTENEITDNTIGTNYQGLLPLGNGDNGIRLDRSSNNAIFYNQISGNGVTGDNRSGILLNQGGTTGNRIGANLIGISRNGIDALGNLGNGIALNAASSNIIGDVFGDGEFNYISGNQSSGITLIQSSNSNSVIGNMIGVGTDGMSAVSNRDSGISIVGSSDNIIGGTNSNESNLIAYNQNGGVVVEEFLGTIPFRNEILGNSIFSNSGPGIDLGSDGITINDDLDPDSGPNNLQNYPDLISTSFDDVMNEVDVTYSLSSDPSNSDYPVRIEFFAVNSNQRQGKDLLGSDSYSQTDFTAGDKTVNLLVPAGITFEAGDRIVATATDNQGNSSEFSETIFEEIVLGTEDFVVVNTDDSGEGSFRQVIENVNRSSEAKTITFDIQDPGPHIIQPLNIYNSFNNTVIIDGTSQPGYSEGNPMIVLDGSLVSDESGIEFTGAADNSSVLGLSIINFDKSGIFTIGDGITIQGNFIGIGPDGVAGPNGTGISMLNSVNNQIGGVLPGERNVISGNNVGIDFEPGSGQSVVEGNFIGTDPDGTQALGNKFNVQIRGSIENRIGGSSPEQRNIIAGAFFEQTDGLRTGGSGIVLTSGTTTSNTTVNSTGNIITGNYIGTDVTGTVSLANERAGVLLLFGSNDNRVGGETAGERNVISGNGLYGVYFQGDVNREVENNLIQGNYIGVDASGSTALPNDVGIWMLENNNSNIIGTAKSTGENVISGNNLTGILILEGDDNVIIGNIIGTDSSGSIPIPNQTGIEIRGSGGSIGGATASERNLISGNTDEGIYLNEASNVRVEGNYIGIDKSGTSAIPEQSFGIRISSGNNHTIVNNTISGNTNNGIRIDNNVVGDAGAENITVIGNMIGTDPNGEAPIGNVGSGILIVGSSNNSIGGELETEKNIISANGGGFEGFFVRSNGIYLTSESNNNFITGNYIGTNRSGEFVQVLGNSSNGILIDEGSSGNTIGVDQNGAGAPNIIVANGINTGASGITIVDNSLNNRVSGNSVFSNGGIGIDLGNDGISENDADDADTGPNLLQNYPLLSSVTFDDLSSQLTVSFSIPSDPSNSNYPLQIELYKNSGNRQGDIYLGSALFQEVDFESDKEFVLTLPESVTIAPDDEFTALTISSTGNTSEFGSIVRLDAVVTIPDAPILTTPSNNATDISINPAFGWESVTEAVTYDLQISEAEEFTSTIINETGITNTEFQAPQLSYSMLYYWRVRAVNAAGQSEWSNKWSYTTEAEPLSPPEVVTLSSPANQAVDVPINPTLSWEASTDATSYDVQVSLSNDFTTQVVDEADVTATELAVADLAYERLHYWRVRAVNSAGNSVWSQFWSFTTEVEPLNPPVTVTLVSPADQSQDIRLDPTLEWEESTNADSYSIQLSENDQLSEDDQFTSFIINVENITSLNYSVEDLDGLTEYFWRVKAVNADGESPWSQVWSFTTMEATSIVDERLGLPETLELSQNYPNPFNPTTQIELALPEAGDVILQVFDMLGRQVGTIVDQRLPAGRYSFSFDASYLTSGTYIYRIDTGSDIRTRKMTLIK